MECSKNCADPLIQPFSPSSPSSLVPPTEATCQSSREQSFTTPYKRLHGRIGPSWHQGLLVVVLPVTSGPDLDTCVTPGDRQLWTVCGARKRQAVDRLRIIFDEAKSVDFHT